MLVSAHVIMGVSYSKPGTGGMITAVLMVSGIVCAYLDFLTAETLTRLYGVPMTVCPVTVNGRTFPVSLTLGSGSEPI